MVGDALKKVQAGQTFGFPAEAYNTLVDLSRWMKSQQRGATADPGTFTRDSGVTLVRNSSGADVSRFAVLSATGTVIGVADEDEFLTRVVLDGFEPDADTGGKFVVTVEPILDGEIGRCIAAGVTQVQVKNKNDAHEFATPVNGESGHLETAQYGPARILWRETGAVDAVVWAIVRIEAGSDGVRWGKLTGNWTQGTATVTAKLCDKAGTTDTVDTADWTIYLVTPRSATARGFAGLVEDAVIAFFPTGDHEGQAFGLARVTGSAQYQVLQMVTATAEGFDYVKAH